MNMEDHQKTHDARYISDRLGFHFGDGFANKIRLMVEKKFGPVSKAGYLPDFVMKEILYQVFRDEVRDMNRERRRNKVK